MFRSMGCVVSLCVLSVACDKSASTTGSNASGGASAEAKGAAAGGVADACGLVPDADLAAAFGGPQGPGKPMRVSPDRSTCMYTSTGLITAVEVAGNYDTTKSMIEGQGRKTTPIAGVGSAAFHDSAGQIVIKGKRVFVAVTKYGASVDAMKGIGAKLLAAADR